VNENYQPQIKEKFEEEERDKEIFLFYEADSHQNGFTPIVLV
jgi:hypothetical protein